MENGTAVKRRTIDFDPLTALTSEEKPATLDVKYTPRIRWLDLMAQIFVHFGGIYGVYLMFASAQLVTTLWGNYNFRTSQTKKQ